MQQLSILLADLDPERVEEALWEAGALSVTLADAADQPIFEPDRGTTPLWSQTRMVGLFDDATQVAAARESLTRALAPATPQMQVETLEDRDWVRAWMDDFQPMRFGERLWIVPEGF